jgi:uncharacterized protein YjgD (DUF1641 family)
MAKEIGYRPLINEVMAKATALSLIIGPEQTADILEFMSFSIRNHSANTASRFYSLGIMEITKKLSVELDALHKKNRQGEGTSDE